MEGWKRLFYGAFYGEVDGSYGGFYGRTDGVLRWVFTDTVRLATSLLVYELSRIAGPQNVPQRLSRI